MRTGLCSYYRHFVKGFLFTTAKPLHKLMESNWECDQVSITLQLHYSWGQFLLSQLLKEHSSDRDTDASYTGLAAVLLPRAKQWTTCNKLYSKRHSKAERNYCMTRRELLDIAQALEHFHMYLTEGYFHYEQITPHCTSIAFKI